MPIYEYACQECDHVLDALQKMSDAPLVHCPACGEPALRKLMSAPRFRLKGSGWYETDFKDKNQRNVLKSDSDSSGTRSGDSGDSADKSTATKKTETKVEKPASKADD